VRRVGGRGGREGQRASLAGVALALHSLARLLGGAVRAGDLVFSSGSKPRLAGKDAGADFSVSHSGPWVGCAAVRLGCIGFDVELGSGPRHAHWVLCEALVKAAGAGLRAIEEARALPPAAAGGSGLYWRGSWWHAEPLGLFAGAAACVVSSRRVRGIETRAIALGELFAA